MNILTTDEVMEAIRSAYPNKPMNVNARDVRVARVIEAAVLSKLTEQAGEPVAYMYEYSYGSNGDKQGNWPIEMHTHVSFSRTKPDGVASKLYTERQLIAAQQRTAAACATVIWGEGIGKADYDGELNHIAVMLEAGEWRKYL